MKIIKNFFLALLIGSLFISCSKTGGGDVATDLSLTISVLNEHKEFVIGDSLTGYKYHIDSLYVVRLAGPDTLWPIKTGDIVDVHTLPYYFLGTYRYELNRGYQIKLYERERHYPVQRFLLHYTSKEVDTIVVDWQNPCDDGYSRNSCITYNGDIMDKDPGTPNKPYYKDFIITK